MNKLNCIEQVGDFHKLFDAPILDTPQIPSMDRAQLRVRLLQEELDELNDAILNNDLIEVGDAAADLLYVWAGMCLEFGLGDRIKAIFDDVHQSNMSKSCVSMEEAQLTVWHYANKGEDSVESYIKEKNGRFIVYRKDDDKILKSVNYTPANIKQFL